MGELLKVGIALYVVAGCVFCVWDQFRFREALERAYPSQAPIALPRWWDWIMLAYCCSASWPALWLISRFVDEPIGYKRRRPPSDNLRSK